MLKQGIYYTVIGCGMLSAVLMLWFFLVPAGERKLSVDELRTMLHSGATPEERALGAAGLGERQDIASVPALLNALEADSPLVRGQAAVALIKLLGADYYFNPEGTPEQRKVVVDQYRHLWKIYQIKLEQTGGKLPSELAGTGADK